MSKIGIVSRGLMLKLRLRAEHDLPDCRDWQKQDPDPFGSSLGPEPLACPQTTLLPVLAPSEQPVAAVAAAIDLSGIDHWASRGGVC